MAFAIEFKIYITNIYIINIIISKFSYQKKINVIMLPKFNKIFIITFYYIILLFGLAIYL